jgi:hypothetical protein
LPACPTPRPEARDLFDAIAETTAMKRRRARRDRRGRRIPRLAQGQLRHRRDRRRRRRPHRHLNLPSLKGEISVSTGYHACRT